MGRDRNAKFVPVEHPVEGMLTERDDGTVGFSPGHDFRDLDAGESRQVDFIYWDLQGAAPRLIAAAITVTGTTDEPVAGPVSRLELVVAGDSGDAVSKASSGAALAAGTGSGGPPGSTDIDLPAGRAHDSGPSVPLAPVAPVHPVQVGGVVVTPQGGRLVVDFRPEPAADRSGRIGESADG